MNKQEWCGGKGGLVGGKGVVWCEGGEIGSSNGIGLGCVFGEEEECVARVSDFQSLKI